MANKGFSSALDLMHGIEELPLVTAYLASAPTIQQDRKEKNKFTFITSSYRFDNPRAAANELWQVCRYVNLTPKDGRPRVMLRIQAKVEVVQAVAEALRQRKLKAA